MNDHSLATGDTVSIRRISRADLEQIRAFAFTVSIVEPLNEAASLRTAFETTGLWTEDAGAAAIIETMTGRLVGTAQFYRAAPCIHGDELGYILHDPADRGRGYGAQAVSLFSDYLFAARPQIYRQQLLVETWNTASGKLAERCGFTREGLLRSAGFGRGDPADCLIYARTRKDWAAEGEASVSLGGAAS